MQLFLKYYLFIFPIVSVLFWLLISAILSLFGWLKLANKFKYDKIFEGTKVGLFSAKIGLVNYSTSLILYYNKAGIYIKPVIVFRFCHPPIFIPFTEIKNIYKQKTLFTKYYSLVIGNPIISKIKISAKTYNKISFNN